MKVFFRVISLSLKLVKILLMSGSDTDKIKVKLSLMDERSGITFNTNTVIYSDPESRFLLTKKNN